MRLPRFSLLLTLPLLLGACRDSKVSVYRIPKEIDAPAPVASPHGGMAGGGDMNMGGGAVARADGPGLSWTVPSGWQSKGPSGVRKDTLVVGPDAELAVTAFPGDVGGELANINRWRGQLQVAPIGENELAGSVTRLEVDGLKVGVVDIVGGTTDKPARMLGAFVPVGGATWFFKLIGPDAVVAKEKANFLAFLQTLKADASTAAIGSAHGSAGTPPPATAPAAPADMANTEVIKAEGPGLRWSAPAHWESRPAAAMRKATYAVPNAAGAAGDLSVTAFPGDVGGELANLNRWRNQLQLPPLAATEVESSVTRLTVHGLNITVTDFTGGSADKPVRMLGAIVPYGGATWFFKLTGPVDLVAKEKPAFEAFVQTLSAP